MVRFAAEWAKVVMADIREAYQEPREIAKRGGEGLLIKVDVSSEAQAKAVITKTVSAYAHPDVLRRLHRPSGVTLHVDLNEVLRWAE